MAPAINLDFNNVLLLLQRINEQQNHQQQQQQQQQEQQIQQQQQQLTDMAANHLMNALNAAIGQEMGGGTDALMYMLAQYQQQQKINQQYQIIEQLRQQHQQQQHAVEINNNDVEQQSIEKSAFVQTPFQSMPPHTPLQSALSSNMAMVQSSIGGDNEGDASPSQSTASAVGIDALNLLGAAAAASATTSAQDGTPSADTSVFHANSNTIDYGSVGGSEKPKRRSRLGGTSLKTAKVWRYFTQLPHPEQAATCQLCSKIIKATNSSTTGMIRHLRSCHPTEHLIVEEARRQTVLEKTLKNVATEAEKAQILQNYALASCSSSGATTTTTGTTSRIASPLTSSCNEALAAPSTPLSTRYHQSHMPSHSFMRATPQDNMACKPQHSVGMLFGASQQQTPAASRFPSLPTSAATANSSKFGGEYLERVLNIIKKSSEQQQNAFISTPVVSEPRAMAAFDKFRANLALADLQFGVQNNQNSNNDEVVVNNNAITTDNFKLDNDSGLDGTSLTETNDDMVGVLRAVTDELSVEAGNAAKSVQTATTAATNISPQIGATAITTALKSAAGGGELTMRMMKFDTAAIAETGHVPTTKTTRRMTAADGTPQRKANDSYAGELGEEDGELLNESSFSPIQPDENEHEDTKAESKHGVKRPLADDEDHPHDSCHATWTEQQNKLINEQIALMMIIDGAPVSTVERIGFREMIRAFFPRYAMPSADEFSRHILPELPARIGCDFATFREQIQVNNPYPISEELFQHRQIGGVKRRRQFADNNNSVTRQLDFHDYEDVENRSPSSLKFNANGATQSGNAKPEDVLPPSSDDDNEEDEDQERHQNQEQVGLLETRDIIKHELHDSGYGNANNEEEVGPMKAGDKFGGRIQVPDHQEVHRRLVDGDELRQPDSNNNNVSL